MLAENLFFQKKYEKAEKSFNLLKSIGPIYSWYASTSIAQIYTKTQNEKKATLFLQKELDLLKNPNFKQYYEIANFYKKNKYFKESIKYYSLALNDIDQSHSLYPKILEKRGTSYERLDNWDLAEKDLLQSLVILPDQPFVLNYLAYSWIEKRINLNKAMGMLKKAVKLKNNNGYIIDSLGWAYYINKNYVSAEKFLRMAVELMPLDPVINDHYADALWMLNKNIQARYFWKHVLKLD